jgi:hypothetical protein
MIYLFRHYWISICLIIAVAFLGMMMWLLWFPVTWVIGELLLGTVIVVLIGLSALKLGRGSWCRHADAVRVS